MQFFFFFLWKKPYTGVFNKINKISQIKFDQKIILSLCGQTDELHLYVSLFHQDENMMRSMQLLKMWLEKLHQKKKGTKQRVGNGMQKGFYI